jgi:hypothetical protein
MLADDLHRNNNHHACNTHGLLPDLMFFIMLADDFHHNNNPRHRNLVLDPASLENARMQCVTNTSRTVDLLSQIRDLRVTTKSGQPCLDLRLPGHRRSYTDRLTDRQRGRDVDILAQLAPLLKGRPHVVLHVVDLDGDALAALGRGVGPAGGESVAVHMYNLGVESEPDYAAMWAGLMRELPKMSELLLLYWPCSRFREDR